jgi:hypothetical protein
VILTKAPLVPQPLMDGGDCVGFQHLVDQLVVGRDLGEPRVLQFGRAQVREPLTEQIRSARGTEAITGTDLTDLTGAVLQPSM